MTNCPNCGAPYALDSPVCEYCGTAREDEDEDGGEWIEMKNILGETFRYYEPRRHFDSTQQTACGAQALANAASHNTCSFEQMRLDAMQAQFTAAERKQTARLMQNAFPHTPPPASVRRKEKRHFSPADPFLFWLGVVCLILCVLLAMLPFTGNIQDWDVLPLGVKIFTGCFAAFACLAIAWDVWKSYKGPIW